MLSWYRKLTVSSNVASAFSAFGVLVTSIVGVMLVSGELKELTKQNAYLEQTLRQTYRPLGVVSYSTALDEQLAKWTVAPGNTTGTFGFLAEPFLHNEGKGVLSYLGVLTYFAGEQLAFRKLLLEGKLDTIIFDGRLPYSRRKPIRPGQAEDYKIVGNQLPLRSEYFVYTLLLYEDQDGNLYDTERLDHFTFHRDPELTPTGAIPKASRLLKNSVF